MAAITDPARVPRTLAAIVEADREAAPRLVGKLDDAELAVLVERVAMTTWGAWISGTAEPPWDELSEKVRERLRLASRAGLAAVDLTPEGGTAP